MSQSKRIRRSLQQRPASSLTTIADFPEPLQEALAYWGAMRQMGFSADEIFFGFDTVNDVPDMVHLALLTQGKLFVVMVKEMPGVSRERVTELWLQLCAVVNTSELPERSANFRKWLIGSSPDYFAAFALAIREKGIIIPEIAHVEAVGSA